MDSCLEKQEVVVSNQVCLFGCKYKCWMIMSMCANMMT